MVEIWGVPIKWGVPQNGWLIMEYPMKVSLRSSYSSSGSGSRLGRIFYSSFSIAKVLPVCVPHITPYHAISSKSEFCTIVSFVFLPKDLEQIQKPLRSPVPRILSTRTPRKRTAASVFAPRRANVRS